MADKEYLQKHHLTEAYKRFQQINEYIVNPGHTMEADEQDPNAQAPAPQDNQQQVPGQVPAPDAPAPDPNSQQGDPNTQVPPAGPDQAPTPEANPAPAPTPNIGGDVAPEAGPDMDAEGEGDEEESDEVIDVDDLTQSQEASEYKLDGVDEKLSTLLNVVDKLTQAIENNDEKVEDLKKEIAMRNPSHQEHLNIRSQAGKPFDVNPQDYWDDTNKHNPNYNVITDNDVAPNDEEKVYTITDKDLADSTTNLADMSKTFDEYPKSLKDYFE